MNEPNRVWAVEAQLPVDAVCPMLAAVAASVRREAAFPTTMGTVWFEVCRFSRPAWWSPNQLHSVDMMVPDLETLASRLRIEQGLPVLSLRFSVAGREG